MAKRNKIDWEAIWPDYRAGALSKREVARQHGVDFGYMCRQAKKLGISRDLSGEVQKAVATKLMTDLVITDNATDDQIIEESSEKVAEVLRLHRKDIRDLRRLEKGLIAELDGKPTKLYIAQYQGKIIQKTVALTVSERAQAANNLANVQHKRVALERQAYGVDTKEREDGDIKSISDDQLDALILYAEEEIRELDDFA